jgi:N-acyl-phosphatidylethanolamine-hydrolysing phospholipase D
MDLWKYHHRTIHFIVPMGLKQWFEASKIPSDRITELDWWNETLISFGPSSEQTSSSSKELSPEAALNMKVAFTPAQHRSGRGLMDHMKTLWGSWCVGVVDQGDEKKAEQRGMKDWSGFKMFFGGYVPSSPCQIVADIQRYWVQIRNSSRRRRRCHLSSIQRYVNPSSR